MSAEVDVASAIDLLKARCLHNLDRLDDAIALLDEFRSNNETHFAADSLLALILQDNGDFARAKELGQTVADSPTPLFEGTLACAEAISVLDGIEPASPYFERAVALSPHTPDGR